MCKQQYKYKQTQTFRRYQGKKQHRKHSLFLSDSANWLGASANQIFSRYRYCKTAWQGLHLSKSQTLSCGLEKHPMQFVLLCDASWKVQAHHAGWGEGQTALARFLFVEVNAGLPGKAQGRNFICSGDENQKVFES